jgi:hypothetical protein
VHSGVARSLSPTDAPTVKETFAPVSPGEGAPPGLWSGYMSKGAKPQTALREMFSIAPSTGDLQDSASLNKSWGGPVNRCVTQFLALAVCYHVARGWCCWHWQCYKCVTLCSTWRYTCGTLCSTRRYAYGTLCYERHQTCDTMCSTRRYTCVTLCSTRRYTYVTLCSTWRYTRITIISHSYYTCVTHSHCAACEVTLVAHYAARGITIVALRGGGGRGQVEGEEQIG